jgi:hypothetical protein
MLSPDSTSSIVLTMLSSLRFIRDAQQIDETLHELLRKLKRLERLLKDVHETCQQADEEGGDGSSRHIKDALKQCERKLREVQELVEGLASRPSNTMLQSFKLVVKNRAAKKKVDKAIEEIEELMDLIHKGISLWTLRKTSIIEQRISQTQSLSQATAIRSSLQQAADGSAEEPLRMLERSSTTFSNTDTLFESCLPSPTRSLSSSTDNSRGSVSSASSSNLQRRETQRTGSIGSIAESEQENSARDDFHYKIKSCGGKAPLIQEISATLDGSPTLVNSKDGSKRSPMHMVAQRGDVKLAEVLLQKEADLNAKDWKGFSVLDLAIEGNHESFVYFLLNEHVNESAISEKNRERFDEIKHGYEELASIARKKSSTPKKSKKATKNPTRRTSSGIST